MSSIVFGKSFSQSVTLSANDKNILPDSLVSARIYSDAPSQAQLEDHSNALAEAVQSKTSWSSSNQDNEFSITFDAIDDPDSQSSAEYEDYFLVLSVKLESGGDTIFSQQSVLRVYRVRVILSRVEISRDDVKQLEDKLEDVMTDSEIDQKIDAARARVFNKLKGRGLSLDRIRQSDLDEIILYQSMVYCCRSLTGDHWRSLTKEYQAELKEVWTETSIGHDVNKDGDFGSEEKFESSTLVFTR